MRKIATHIFTLFSFFISTVVLAQKDNSLPVFNEKEMVNYPAQLLLKEKISSLTAIRLYSKEIERFCKAVGAKKNLHLQFGAELNFDPELEPSNLISPDYKLQTSNGGYVIRPVKQKGYFIQPEFLNISLF